jgi:molybdopterin-guanine dinucleotide biosynthesis adapter protein
MVLGGTEDHAPMKVIGFSGYSGSGKTTLIERLLPRLVAKGLRVSVLKQSHHDIDLDTPGKDSWRHRQAGAHEVLLATPARWMLVHESRGAPTPDLATQLACLSPCDLVLVEGFRHDALPKLEVHRVAQGKPWLHTEDSHILAVVSDTPPPGEIRHLRIDDIDAVHAFLLDFLSTP